MATYLVDGTFELFRCFHGAPRARHDGREVGAVRALAQTLISLLRAPDLEGVAIAFDPLSGTVRRAGDLGPTASIRDQYPLAADLVRALGVRLWPMVRYAADDALATGAARVQGRVVICTTDLDLAQSVEGERVVLLDRIRDRVTDEAGVRQRFGVAPSQVPDWLALVGDRSDGLPGLSGCGPRTAAALLGAFGDVASIPLDAAHWPSVRNRAAVFEGFLRVRDELVLHAALSRKHTDLPIPCAPEDLRWDGADREALAAVAARLGAPEILERTLRVRKG